MPPNPISDLLCVQRIAFSLLFNLEEGEDDPQLSLVLVRVIAIQVSAHYWAHYFRRAPSLLLRHQQQAID